MNDSSSYTPPSVWSWKKEGGGRFANINRPIAGSTHEKDLPVGRHPMQLYSLATPNGVKVTVMLEELLALGHAGAEYDAWLIRISEGDQFGSGFVAVNPNSKIPALLDRSEPTPVRVFESGAILLYLAGKTGRFLPASVRGKYETLQWLMLQMGGIGPMFGQCHHFRHYAPEPIPYAIDRYTNETRRLYGVLDRQLANNDYVAGREYTIADMSVWPWVRSFPRQGVDLDEFPNVRAWFEAIGNRPAVQKGVTVLADRRKPLMDDKAKENLFGATQYQRR